MLNSKTEPPTIYSRPSSRCVVWSMPKRQRRTFWCRSHRVGFGGFAVSSFLCDARMTESQLNRICKVSVCAHVCSTLCKRIHRNTGQALPKPPDNIIRSSFDDADWYRRLADPVDWCFVFSVYPDHSEKIVLFGDDGGIFHSAYGGTRLENAEVI